MWSDGGVADEGSPTVLRRVAEIVATEAAQHLRGRPRPGGFATKSSPTDVVTAADTAVEELLRARLARLRPGEAVTGEEGGTAGGELGAAAGRTGGDGVTWVVDPIDGTVNYLHGLPWYAVSVAATRAGVAVAGAVAEPGSGRLWSAASGAGATCDGRPLRVSGLDDVGRAVVGTGFAYRATRRAAQARMVAELLPRIGDVRRTGSAALDACAVAAGWLDGYLEHGTNWWDWAAATLIAAEAGAVVRVPGPPGSAAPGDGLGADAVLVATPGIAAALADLARAHGAAEI
ncbi:MAG: inositol monophosphatase family protein [Pseudonocardia sp.]